MKPRYRPAALALLLLIGVGCEVGPQPMTSAPPPTASVAASRSTAGASATSIAGAAATSTRSTYPAEGRPTIAFRVVNKAGHSRHTRPNRGFFDAVKLQRRQGDAWQAIASQPPTCSEPCPVSKPRCVSADCRPPMPRAETIDAGEEKERHWGGQQYEQTREGNCWCHREVAAPLGRYRLEACVLSSCQGPGCPPGGESAPSEPLCFRSEFDHNGTDQVVTVSIDR